uniref:Uncharacterized protein n=1 Tax=Anguilla anguilla TaxID=7936 RepID=A0A0E9Q0C8_ANGAN
MVARGVISTTLSACAKLLPPARVILQ